MQNLLTIMKIHDITVNELATKLDVATSQIYRWNKKGISQHNPHFKQLKEILPEVKPKEKTLTKNGKEDSRYKAGRKKKKLILTETNIKESEKKEFKSKVFPKIYINKGPQ